MNPRPSTDGSDGHLAGCPECDSSLGRNPEVRDGTGFRLTLTEQEF